MPKIRPPGGLSCQWQSVKLIQIKGIDNHVYYARKVHVCGIPFACLLVEYKLAVIFRRCLDEQSIKVSGTPVADIASRHRRSANLHHLIVPQYRCGPSLSGVRPSGTHCLSNCVNRLLAAVSFGAQWRQSCSLDTSAPSSIEMLLREIAL